jgi:hypothetical protein
MKYKYIIILLILLLPICKFVVSEENNFQLKDVYWQTLNIGGNSTCKVSLLYIGNTSCQNIEAIIDVSEISENYTTISDKYDGTLEYNNTVYFSFEFDISSSCKKGWYNVPLKINYIKDGKYLQEEFNLILTINGRPDINVTTNSNKITRGYVNNIKFTIFNKGDGLARNIVVRIQTQDVYLTIINRNEYEKDFLEPKENWTISFDIFAQLNVRDGSGVTLNIAYEDQRNNQYTMTLSFGFKVEDIDRPRMELNVSESKIHPGMINNITLSISNIGNDAYNLTIKINPATNQLTLMGNNSFFISKLLRDEKIIIPLSLYLEPKTYGSLPLHVDMSYYDERNSQYQDSLNIGLMSEEEPRPIIKVSTESNELTPNSVNKIVIILTNIGEKEAKHISTNLASQSPQIAIIVGDGWDYKEELKPNESWKIEKNVFIQPNVYGAIPLYLNINFEDDLNNKYSYTTTIGFELKGTSSISISNVIYIPSPVFPGDKVVKASCVIVNNGNYTAQDISITLGSIENIIKPSYIGSDRIKIPFLPVGGSINVYFLIDIDENAKPGYYEIPITITTRNENYSTTLPLSISEKAELSIEKIYFDREVFPGTRNAKLIIEINNLGNVTAKNVRISVISPYISGSTSSLLGDIPSGSKKVVMMEVDIDNKANPGEQKLDIEITWTQDERMLSKTIISSINISEKSISEIILPITIAIIILIIVTIIFRKKIISILKS